MNFRLSKHAKERISDRGINHEVVSKIITNPDAVIKKSECKHIFQKIFNESNTKYLYRVFINICKQPPLVITAYKTSKIDKYEH